jgi:hypothetical protein
MEKFTDRVHGVVDRWLGGSMVDQWWRGREMQWRLVDAWRTGSRGCQCSLAVVGEDEEDEVEPMRGSLEHMRRRGGAAIEAESDSTSSSVQEWRRLRENSGVRGKGTGCSGVVLSLL